jgi:hypothetical protein
MAFSCFVKPGVGTFQLAARPGHLLYCFGDVDSRYSGFAGSAGSDFIMKQIWLEFNGK